jgi:hypothetical protein
LSEVAWSRPVTIGGFTFSKQHRRIRGVPQPMEEW